MPVRVVNDANCFALSEALHGAGKGYGMVLGIILGTGMGGGLVLDGKLWSGSQGIAGEWGHIALEPNGITCFCGNVGCIDTCCIRVVSPSSFAQLVLINPSVQIHLVFPT